MRNSFFKYCLIFVPLLGLAALLLAPLPHPLFPDDYSATVLDRNGRILRVFLNRGEQWLLPPQPQMKIPEKLEAAVLSYEDQYFYYHPGVNPAAVLRAMWQNWRAGKTISGASTITMQVIRLSHPRDRTYWNKLVEVLQALHLELRESKQTILRYYLDHAPYGGNIRGYQAASLRYFGKEPRELTWGEAATLAVLPNAPGLISPGRNRKQLIDKRNRLLQRFLAGGQISAETYALAAAEPLPTGGTAFPRKAAHLARRLKTASGTRGGLIRTTIDGGIQARCEELVGRHVDFLRGMGIRNGAALVADTRSGEVLAYVGSQDFFDSTAAGQVDGVMARRSSGSLLKPFLYALSIDEGLILPESLVKDVPSFYGAFSPSNADEKFSGILPARQALVRSLNVPAVRLLYSYGVYPFYLFLKSAGVSTLSRPADDYGLPLIIGGAEVNLWDMAMLFRGLAGAGRFSALRVCSDDKASPAAAPSNSPLISPEACYLTLQMLRDVKRPGIEYYWEQFQEQRPLAWKTGTSYGQRDAWAVGVSPGYTIAVWVGNFSGEGNANLSGSRCAGPLLFDIFNSLPAAGATWFEEPGELQRTTIKICRESGFLAGPYCPHPVSSDAPRYMKPLKVCPYHRQIFVTDDQSFQVCSLCWENGRYHPETRLVFPPDVEQFLRQAGQPYAALPPHRPDCPAHNGQLAMQIVYPQERAHLFLPRDFGGVEQMITARAAHRDGRQTIFWYLDDRYLGETQRYHEQPLLVEKGWHTLEIVDGAGERESRRFYVDRPPAR